MKKSIFLVLSLFCSDVLPQSGSNTDQEVYDQVEQYVPSFAYKVCGLFGSLADLFFSRGFLSAENQKIFLEAVEKQKVGDRNIQIRNMGFLLRLVLGYNNAGSSQWLNRVYVNEDDFAQLSDGAKRFLMARCVAKHKQFHHLEAICLNRVVQPLFLSSAWKLAIKNNLGREVIKRDKEGKNVKDKQGRDVKVLEVNPDHNAFVSYPLQYILGVNQIFSLIELFLAQMVQRREFNADKAAVTRGGVPIKGGIDYINYVYNPDTTQWPAYARMRFLIDRVGNFLGCLPVIKQHTPFLPSADDRIDALKAIE